MATTTLVRTPTSTPTKATTVVSPSTKAPPIAPSYPPSPGNWRHPKFTEIVKRQSAAHFSDRNLRGVLLNALALLISFFFASSIHTAINTTLTILAIPNVPQTTFWFLLTIRLYLLTNIVYALSPILPIKARDQITDIPLTPSQRQLLGLDPSIPSSSSPSLPGHAPDSTSSFVTPPRYRRSSGSNLSFSTDNNGSNSLNATPDRRSISATYFSSSPLSSPSSRNFSPSSVLSPFRSRNASPFSPSASPLLQKAIAMKQTNNNNREDPDWRSSVGTPGPVAGLGRSQSMRERGGRAGTERDRELGADSPSPVGGGVRRNPHLNYKWLYEKGARLPMSETMQF